MEVHKRFVGLRYAEACADIKRRADIFRAARPLIGSGETYEIALPARWRKTRPARPPHRPTAQITFHRLLEFIRNTNRFKLLRLMKSYSDKYRINLVGSWAAGGGAAGCQVLQHTLISMKLINHYKNVSSLHEHMNRLKRTWASVTSRRRKPLGHVLNC
ncbi:hypothetical protein EVAR_64688_1 [Eumeta japonica]|uniref:Uncharacterized protein n=1 Tax=Eumeta variegata TaxID=151549 RepID=A0A4C1ZPN2_EUMVA|nr:hypothetical protein EVAR_64688_1 [Eumeta japonica]